MIWREGWKKQKWRVEKLVNGGLTGEQWLLVRGGFEREGAAWFHANKLIEADRAAHFRVVPE